MQSAVLLAILDARPIDIEAIAFMSDYKRKRALKSIETFIDYLDAIEPDPDLEDDRCDEPYMSRTESGAGVQGVNQSGYADDECEDCGDEEPSFGSLGGCGRAADADQRLWACGDRTELEEENEHGGNILDEPHDEMDEGNHEPSLGSLDRRIDQTGWTEETSWPMVSTLNTIRPTGRSATVLFLGQSGRSRPTPGTLWRAVSLSLLLSDLKTPHDKLPTSSTPFATSMRFLKATWFRSVRASYCGIVEVGMSDRRSFLRGLASLPLIGGSVALIGHPTAAAVPVSRALQDRYIAWLAREHRAALNERHPGWTDWTGKWHDPEPPMVWIPEAPDVDRLTALSVPSSRAAVILSAAGVPLS